MLKSSTPRSRLARSQPKRLSGPSAIDNPGTLDLRREKDFTAPATPQCHRIEVSASAALGIDHSTAEIPDCAFAEVGASRGASNEGEQRNDAFLEP